MALLEIQNVTLWSVFQIWSHIIICICVIYSHLRSQRFFSYNIYLLLVLGERSIRVYNLSKNITHHGHASYYTRLHDSLPESCSIQLFSMDQTINKSIRMFYYILFNLTGCPFFLVVDLSIV